MKLLTPGATGLTSRHIVYLALRSGDSVTAFVRNPRPCPTGSRPSPETPLAPRPLDRPPGHDAGISALGASNFLTSLRADELLTRSSTAVIGVAMGTGVRLVWLVPFGVSHTFDWSSTPQKLINRTLWGTSTRTRRSRTRTSSPAAGLDHRPPDRLTNDPAMTCVRRTLSGTISTR